MIHKITLKDHKKHKSKLLKLIDDMPKISLVDSGERVDKSDWLLLSNYKRDYWHYFADNLLEHFWIDMKKRYDGELKIINFWFHQYNKDNHYNWHTHPDSHFSSVYFLELPKKDQVTEFKDGTKVQAKEGDIITFPGYALHRSPMNLTNDRKTTIIFNSSVWPLTN